LLAIARVKVLLLIENTTDPLESELGVPLQRQLLRDLYTLAFNSINLLSIETE
jgi:hypothetical protein